MNVLKFINSINATNNFPISLDEHNLPHVAYLK